MHRLFAIFTLVLMLVANTELYQLAKLPVLLEHYREHRAGAKLSFLDFLGEHYFNGDQRKPDYERDMQLPFKTPSSVSSVTFILAVPEQPIIGIMPLSLKETKESSHYTYPPSSTALQDIFQPPKA